jgi:hypothetical protein
VLPFGVVRSICQIVVCSSSVKLIRTPDTVWQLLI